MMKGQVLNFEDKKNNGEVRSSIVRVLDEGVEVGKGSTSDSVKRYQTSVSFILDGETKAERDKTFIIKECHGEHGAKKAIKGYQALRDNGLKTWTTCRRSGRFVLMTNGSTRDQVMICGVPENINDGDAVEIKERGGIDEITNFPEFLRSIYKEAKKAREKGIGIIHDSYLFSIDRGSKTTDIDFMIGDTGNIIKAPANIEPMGSQYEQLNKAIDDFIFFFVSPDKINLYKGQASKVYGRYEDSLEE